MDQQHYRRPNFREDNDNNGVYDDGPKLSGSQHGQEVSAGAQGTLDDIDNLLNDVQAAEANPDQAAPESTAAQAATNEKPPEVADEDTASGRVAGFLKSGKGKKTAAGTGIVGLAVGFALWGLGLSSGPLQVIHLAQVLQAPFKGTNSSTQSRLDKLFRYTRASKTGDIGESRVGKLGSITFGKTIQQLSDVGVEFQRNNTTGDPKAMFIDTSKNPELKGMSRSQAADAISKKFGIPLDQIARVNMGSAGTGDKFAINTRDIGLRGTRALTRSSLTYLENGKLVTGIQFRVMAKFFNVPSLFHPLKAATASQENKLATVAERRAAEEKRATELEKPVVDSAETAKASIKDQLSGLKQSISNVLLLTAGMCLVRAVADDVVTVNNAAIAVPAALQATDKIAVGEQVEADSPDVTGNDVGAVVESFKDASGKTIWDAKSLQVMSGNQQGGTADLPQDYKQAFSNDTTAQHIKDFLGGGTAGDIACSTAGQIIQGIAGIAIIISGFFDAGVSWGAKAAQEGVAAAGTAGAMYFIEQQATNILSDKALMPALLSGPLGGNLLAYGAREAGNISAIASGGIALTSSQETALQNKVDQQDLQEFKSQSMFAQIFNLHDYRSVASRAASSLSPSFAGNVDALTNNLANIGNLLPHLFSSFTPKAHAVAVYDWGFPKYEIPLTILNDPKLADPYANADTVSTLLDDTANQGYIDKANICFGVDINKDSGQWDVIQSHPINVNTEEYTSANCNDTSDYNWKRMILFVKDTLTMKNAACYQGDDSACPQNADTTASATPPPTSSAGYQWPLSPAILSGVTITNCWRDSSTGFGHTGIDMPVPVGTPVFAGMAGTVVQAGPGGDAGNYIMIKHSDGHWTNYQHLSKIEVSVNQQVATHQEIARSGDGGYSYSGVPFPHLHFSITTAETLSSRFNTTGSINPLPFLPTSGAPKIACR